MLTDDEMEISAGRFLFLPQDQPCPIDACELKLFSNSGKVKTEGDLAAAENVNFSGGGGEWKKN